MVKVKYLGVAGFALAAFFAFTPNNASAAYTDNEDQSCSVTNETDLKLAVLADVCDTVILDGAAKSRGIKITDDFNGNGKTLKLGAGVRHGLSVWAGTDGDVTLENFTIMDGDDAENWGLITLGGQSANAGEINSVTLKDVTSDRTGAQVAWPAHINVKDLADLTLIDYKAIGGLQVVDYSPAGSVSTPYNPNNELTLTLNGFEREGVAAGLNNDDSAGTFKLAGSSVNQIGDIAQGWTGVGTNVLVVKTKEELIAAGSLVDTFAPEVKNMKTETTEGKDAATVTLTFNEQVTVTSGGWTQADESGAVWAKTFIANATDEVVNFVDTNNNASSTTVTVSSIVIPEEPEKPTDT